MLGISQSVETILDAAYGADAARTVISSNVKLPQDKYDFIANLRSGNEPALQKEIKRNFGLNGTFETRDADVLCLEIQGSGATGLKPANHRQIDPRKGTSSGGSGPGYFHCKNQPLSNLTEFIESCFNVPVVDQTGLIDRFDIDLNWHDANYQHPNLEKLKQALLNQLGLALVPSNMPVQMLVVEKAD
jgi:uncharacterized protein (TIGR03435 family)